MDTDANTAAATIGRYIRLPYAVQIVEDDCDGQRCYVARHPELMGCMAQGWNPEEALTNLNGARAEYLTTLIELGLEVPLPKSMEAMVQTAPTGVIGYIAAGQPAFSVRLVPNQGMIPIACTITRLVDLADHAVR